MCQSHWGSQAGVHVGFSSKSTFSASAILLETSGKTEISRTYGLGRLICAFSLLPLSQ